MDKFVNRLGRKESDAKIKAKGNQSKSRSPNPEPLSEGEISRLQEIVHTFGDQELAALLKQVESTIQTRMQ